MTMKELVMNRSLPSRRIFKFQRPFAASQLPDRALVFLQTFCVGGTCQSWATSGRKESSQYHISLPILDTLSLNHLSTAIQDTLGRKYVQTVNELAKSKLSSEHRKAGELTILPRGVHYER